MNWKCLYLVDLGVWLNVEDVFFFLIFDERSSSWGGLKDKLIRSHVIYWQLLEIPTSRFHFLPGLL